MKKPQEGRYMGFYMDSASPKTLYRRVYNGTYFVDKSMMLKEIFKYIDAGDEYICVTRPRRFGKTVMANMIAAFLTDAVDSSDIFDHLKISQDKDYKKLFRLISASCQMNVKIIKLIFVESINYGKKICKNYIHS